MKTSHAVTILGRELSVRSSAPAEKVREIESFVNRRLLQIGSALSSSDAQLVLTLALLNTAEELIDLRSHQGKNGLIDGRIQEIIRKLETA
jgi:cell division protein ZapA